MQRIALLALALALLIPGCALAAPGDATVARSDEIQEKYGDYIQSACVAGDALYLLGGSHIFRYRVGDAEMAALEFESPEVGEDEAWSAACLFSDGEALYMLGSVSRNTEEGTTLQRAEILPVEPDGERARLGAPVGVDIGDLTVSYGDGGSTYLVQINDACCVGGCLMLYIYDSSDREALYALDVASGEGRFVEGVEGLICIAPYGDGQLLIERFDYDARSCAFDLYDPEAESLTSACAPIALNEDEYGIYNLAYSPESGRLFFRSDGYVMAMEDFDYANARAVAELSTIYSENRGALVLPGDYYVYSSYEGTVIRATDPDALPDTRLVVYGAGNSDATMDAYYAFGNAHSDVAVVLDQHSFTADTVIEAMMNRDDSVDIYMLSVGGETYEALYNRGYMVELDDGEIAAAVERMYPAVRDAITRDGKLVAVPVSVYGWLPGLDVEGFEKIGIAREDLPADWKGLLELLPRLPEKLPEDGSVTLFGDYETQSSVRSGLFGVILEAWRAQADADGRELRYDDPTLLGLMEQVQALDLEALGLPEGEDESGYSVYAYGSERTYQLVQFSTGCTIGNFYSNAEPVALSVIPGEEAPVPLSLNVAFVNPFSKHAELAQAFLVELLANLDVQTRYNLSDELNEPVRDERTLKYMEEERAQIDGLRAKLETADAVDKPALQEQIDDLERLYADQEKHSWSISQWEIDWYRGHGDRLTVERFDYMSAADEDGELFDMAQQMLDGRVTIADFLKEVDRKVRMRQMEGS